MKRATLLLIILSVIPINSFAQDLDKLEKELTINNKLISSQKNNARALTLNDAIEMGLRLNIQEKTKKYEFEINENNFQDAKHQFYYPKLSLTLQTTQDHITEDIYRDQLNNTSVGKTPTGFLAFGFEDYTLFNWGRDYLEFVNARETYNREKLNFDDRKRALRFKIIDKYFNLSRTHQIVKIYKQKLKHTSFIYRLSKEKLSLKRIRYQEFLQTKSEFLAAHEAYQDSLYYYYQIQEDLADLIGDNLNTIYNPTNQLKFKTLTMSNEESQKMALAQNPNILDAKVKYENSRRSFQKVRKDNLPLPKLSLKLSSYQRGFSSSGVSDSFQNTNGNNNIELAASLNMKWSIWGPGGVMNSRTTQSSYYKQKIAELNLRESKRATEVTSKAQSAKISYLEKKYRASSKRLDNARKTFDKTLDNYISGKTPYANIKIVLDQLVQSGVSLETTKYSHLSEKLKLAEAIGIDDFPGESFERLLLQ